MLTVHTAHAHEHMPAMARIQVPIVHDHALRNDTLCTAALVDTNMVHAWLHLLFTLP